MRIFIGLTEVSGFFHRLKIGFDELGVEAQHISLHQHKFSYADTKHTPSIVRFAQSAVSNRVNALNQGKRVRAMLWLVPTIATRLFLFIWALIKFDAFIIGAGSSFFSFRELPILRFFNKKVVYTLHGTDARPPYIDGFFDPSQYGIKANDTIADKVSSFVTVAAYRRQRVQYIENNAYAVACGPSYAQFLSKPFINFYCLGLPADIHSYAEEYKKTTFHSDKVRILHAPSHLAGKGTQEIRQVMQNLLKKNLAIEYIEISGKQNAEVLKEIARSDLIVDQFYSDTPMAAFATEAAMLGKPAVVGGYYSKTYKDEITAENLPPTVFCLPEEVEQTLEKLILDKPLREALGDQARAFVEKHWHAKTVAARFLQLFEQVPTEWLISPQDCHHLQGIGLHQTQARANITDIINGHGVEGLQLAHKPYLQERYRAFSQESIS